jgi:hypothetical protein
VETAKQKQKRKQNTFKNFNRLGTFLADFSVCQSKTCRDLRTEKKKSEFFVARVRLKRPLHIFFVVVGKKIYC